MFALAKDLLNRILKRGRHAQQRDVGDAPVALDSSFDVDVAAGAMPPEDDIPTELEDAGAVDDAFSIDLADNADVENVDGVSVESPEYSSPQREPAFEYVDSPETVPGEHAATPSTASPAGSLPPRKASDQPASPVSPVVRVNKTKEELLARPVPPRRPRSRAAAAPAPPVDTWEFEGSPDAIPESEPADAVRNAQDADNEESAAEIILQLRLALEASQADQNHLNAARDQALSQVAQQEAHIRQLQAQIQALQTEDATWREEKESLGQSIDGLQGTIAGLQSDLENANLHTKSLERKLAECPTPDAIQSLHDEHQTAVDELRTILGQREAAEASLLRERDNLRDHNSELQKTVEDLKSKNASEATPTTGSDSASGSAPPLDHSAEHQSILGELSLANESIRQLNQNLSQRDAQLLEMRRENQHLQAQLSDLHNAAPNGSDDAASLHAELETEVTQLKQEMQQRQNEQQSLRDQLGAAQEEVNAKSIEMRRMREQLAEAEKATANTREAEAALGQAEAATERLTEELRTKQLAVKSLQDDQIELKQELACLTEASENWAHERSALLERFGLDEDGNPHVADQDSASAGAKDEELLAQVRRWQTLLEDRDAAVVDLQQRIQDPKFALGEDQPQPQQDDDLGSQRDQAAAAAAEASETIAQLMTDCQSVRSAMQDQQTTVSTLSDENAEYRRSVADLHAKANELEELKTNRAKERETARQRLQEATTANAELSDELAALRQRLAEGEKQQTDAERREQELETMRTTLQDSVKNLSERDDQLEQLAQQLSRARGELATLNSELVEQKAVVRALQRGEGLQRTTDVAEKNGRPPARNTSAKRNTRVDREPRKATTKTASKSRGTKSVAAGPHANMGVVFSARPEIVDDLKQIRGIGPALEKRLNSAGIYQLEQIRNWTHSVAEYLDSHLSLGGRIGRQDWIGQARQLCRKNPR